MTTLADLRDQLAATLNLAGLRATTDPRNVNPPCVVVELANGTRITGCAYEGTIQVSVVAPGAGHADAAGWLDETTSVVAALTRAQTWTADTYATPYVPGPLLAYVLTVPAAWEASAP